MSNTLGPIKRFDEESCDRCGRCLQECPVMELPLPLARKEIERLILGNETEEVLKRCTSCYACDLICPQKANPLALILERWHDMVSRQGLRYRSLHFMPYCFPNFRTCVMDKLEPGEKELVREWQDLTPTSEVIYPGCNIMTIPSLTRTQMLKGLDIRGDLQHCCGEMYYRMGMFEQVEQIAARLQRYFEDLGASRVTVLCPACYYILNSVLPEFGAEFKFSLEPYLSLLKRKLDAGEIEIKHPLGIKVALQDSCYGKLLGSDYLDLPREILSRAGVEIVEMEKNRECSLCCGIGSGFSPHSSHNPAKMTLSTINTLRVANRTGADAIAVYCAGCLLMLSGGRIFYRTSKPIFHIIELLQMATGEEPERLAGRRAAQILEGIITHQFPRLLSRRRFGHSKISTDIR